jgi:hypothetical protein
LLRALVRPGRGFERCFVTAQTGGAQTRRIYPEWANSLRLHVEGCLPSALGVRVRQTAGKFTFTDGPFAETKELICGLAILKADSKEQAIELTKQFLSAEGADGECEVRQLHEAGQTPGCEADQVHATAKA